MYLFTRTARPTKGGPRAPIEWAVGITEKVNQIVDFQVSLYTRVFSPQAGTLVWGAVVEDLQELETGNAKLLVDDGFIAEAERGTQFGDQGFDDQLMTILHGQPDPSAGPPAYASTVSTVIAPGKFARGAELGVEIAQRVEAISGAWTMFGMDQTGTYGGARWITGYADVKQLEQAEQAVNDDASFLKFVDENVAGVYLGGSSTEQSIVTRLA